MSNLTIIKTQTLRQFSAAELDKAYRIARVISVHSTNGRRRAYYASPAHFDRTVEDFISAGNEVAGSPKGDVIVRAKWALMLLTQGMDTADAVAFANAILNEAGA